MTLTTLDILYITLSIFTAVIGTLLAVVLFKVIKILWPIEEMVGYYKTMKSYLSAYRQIPLMVREYIYEFVSNLTNKKSNKTSTKTQDSYHYTSKNYKKTKYKK